MRKPGARAGSALLEFTLVGIPAILMVVSVIDAGIILWQYYSLAYGAEVTSRYAGMHGAGCSSAGNSCATTVGALVSMFTRNAPAVDAARLSIVFTDGSGSTRCSPAAVCASSSAQFPATSGNANAVGSDIVIAATFPLTLPILMIWPGAGTIGGGGYLVGATSRQEIVF